MFPRDLFIEYNWLLLQLKRPIYNRLNWLRIFKFNLFIWYVLASASNGMLTHCLYESPLIWNRSKSCTLGDRQSSSYLSNKQLHLRGNTAVASMPSHFYNSTPSWAMDQLLGFSIFSQQHSLIAHSLSRKLQQIKTIKTWTNHQDMPGQGRNRHVHGPYPTLREISWRQESIDKRGSFFMEPFFFLSQIWSNYSLLIQGFCLFVFLFGYSLNY